MSSSARSGGGLRTIEFDPTPTQEKFMKCTDKQVLLSGSFGAGKTRVGCEKGFYLNLRFPGNRGLIVRDNFTDLRASTIEQTLIEEVIPESHLHNHHKTKHKIKHFTEARGENGEPIMSEIHYHGLDESNDQDLPTKIGGQQYGWVFVDEGIEVTKGAWVQLLGRLRYSGKEKAGKRYEVPLRQIFTATNPASKAHWLYRWFFDEGKGTWFKMTARELSDHVPTVPDDYVKTMEDNYEGMYFDRYVKGEWVASQGLVYGEYDQDVHHRHYKTLPRAQDWTVQGFHEYGEYEHVRITPPDDWQVYRSIDFGYRNPFVCQYWAYWPDGQKHVMFREIYRTETLVEDLASEIKTLSSDVSIAKTFADPAQKEDRETLSRHGVETDEAKKDVSAGIQEVKSLLSKDDNNDVDMMFLKGALAHKPDPDIDESNDPISTIEEIVDYQWKDGKDEPEDGNDHGMDTLRYYAHTISQQTQVSRDEMERLEEIFNSGVF